MRYRKSPWYIAGLIIVGIAVAVMLVTMVMMYYGVDAAIVWFFGACPVLLIGYFMVQTTIRRYEDADAIDGEPLPMFWRIRFAYHNLKVRVITQNLWRKIIASLVALSLLIGLILGGVCIYSAFSRKNIKNDPHYKERNVLYNMAMVEWQTARENGDDAKRQESFAEMEAYRNANFEANQQIKEYGETISSCIPWIIFSGASVVFFSTVFYAYVRHQKNKKNEPQTEQTEIESDDTKALDP